MMFYMNFFSTEYIDILMGKNYNIGKTKVETVLIVSEHVYLSKKDMP